jgi:hypothetical protein
MVGCGGVWCGVVWCGYDVTYLVGVTDVEAHGRVEVPAGLQQQRQIHHRYEGVMNGSNKGGEI